MTVPSTVRVLAAVIHDNGRYLICLRPHHKRHGGMWEFPGGKVEPGESDFEATRRELREEIDVEVVAVGSELLAVHDPGSTFLVVFVEVTIAGHPSCREHLEVQWRTPLELRSYDLAPSDRRFVDAVLLPAVSGA